MALVRKRSQSPGGAEDGAVADGHDGEENDGVHDARQHLDARTLDGDDERRSRGIGDALGPEQAGFVVRHEKTDEGEGHDIEYRDAPENLLDGRRQRLAWIGRLGCGEANELGAAISEGGADEHGAETLNPLLKAPGLAQYFPPMYPSVGVPPMLITIPSSLHD